jgi:hypothetical protein
VNCGWFLPCQYSFFHMYTSNHVTKSEVRAEAVTNMVILKPRAAENYVVILVKNFVKIKSSFVSININVNVYYTGNRNGYICRLMVYRSLRHRWPVLHTP